MSWEYWEPKSSTKTVSSPIDVLVFCRAEVVMLVVAVPGEGMVEATVPR